MTPEEIKDLNKDRFTFRTEHSSTTPAPYRRTPGHVLVEEFLVPAYPMELNHLSKRTRIPLDRLHKLIRGRDRIDGYIAEALGRFFRNGAEYWLTLQKNFERGKKL